MESKRLLVSPSPHITSTDSTRKIMAIVCLALLPTLLASSLIFGARVLLVTGVSIAACVTFELCYCLLVKRPVAIGDFSAVVTGLLLAFNLPPAFPLWMTIVGAFVAIVLVKQLFGGIGRNFANPALVGRIVLQLSFPAQMIDYTYPESLSGVDVVAQGTVDAIAQATPLATIGGANQPALVDMLIGTHGGTLGETCALALVLGGLILVFTKVISPAIPVVYIGGTFVLTWIINVVTGASAGASAYSALLSILAGGLLLGAIFMATDYTTSPYTLLGKIVFGLGLAVVTVAIRTWANNFEGISYAILLMSLLVPYINTWCRQRPLGTGKSKAAKRMKGV